MIWGNRMEVAVVDETDAGYPLRICDEKPLISVRAKTLLPDARMEDCPLEWLSSPLKRPR
jgi:hypothetical protein